MRLALVLLAAASTANCANDPPASSPSTPQTQTASAPDVSGAGAPILVRVSGPTSAPEKGSLFDIDVMISRRSPSSVPMALQVTLPPSVKLVSGQSAETIVDDRSEVIHRKLTLQADDSSTDILVTVDTSTASAGAHAKSAYRFGRPEPRLPSPQGTPLIVNGRSLGQPVSLPPPAAPK